MILFALGVPVIFHVFGDREGKHIWLPQPTQTAILQFVHITKTGGSAIEQAAQRSGFAWGFCVHRWKQCIELYNPDQGIHPTPPYKFDLCSYNANLPDCRRAVAARWHAPPFCFLRGGPYRPYDTPSEKVLFMVSRNPLARMISEYNCPWTGYKGSDGATARALNRWISKQLRNGFAGKGGHGIEQFKYLYGDSNMAHRVVQHVLKFEHLNRDFTHLMRQYGYNVTLGHINSSQKGRSRLGVRNLTRETRDLIYKVYRRDFDAFNYSYAHA